jgi:hypothetical protein
MVVGGTVGPAPGRSAVTTIVGTPSDPGRRRSRIELRELLLEAGIQVLREDGLGTGAEQLTFKRVFDLLAATEGVRVTNASVIGRIWENQAEYQSAVLATVAVEEVTDQERAVLEATSAFVACADRSTLEGRRAALRALLRLAAEANLDTGTTSRNWATVVGVWALASGSRGTDASDRIHASLVRAYGSIAERSSAATMMMMDFLGLRVRAPLSVDQFTESCTALVEGCALRDRAGAGIRGIELPTSPDGAMQAWTLLGVGMEALVDQFFEFDPDWSADSTA